MIRNATLPDVPLIKKLIDQQAEKGSLLPRALAELYSNVREFVVSDENGEVVGCASLRIFTGTLGEIRSVCVTDSMHKRGIGRELVMRILDEAESIGLEQVFALTYVAPFFERMGFTKVPDKANFPHKIWNDCMNCPKFPDCDEEALIMELKTRRK